MAVPVLIIGKSGSGKSASMRNCQNQNWNLIKVLNKPLPFKGHIKTACSDDYNKIMKMLSASVAKSIVIDDAGYLITNMFMSKHSSGGTGNAIFELYNSIGDKFWNLIQYIIKLPEDKIIYVIMHEETNDYGQTKPKTIGKLLDDKVCLEGMFTIVLRCIEEGGKHLFVTQAAQGAVSKSPIGMFPDLTIDNDLAEVDKTIREYYGIQIIEEEENEKAEETKEEEKKGEKHAETK